MDLFTGLDGDLSPPQQNSARSPQSHGLVSSDVAIVGAQTERNRSDSIGLQSSLPTALQTRNQKPLSGQVSKLNMGQMASDLPSLWPGQDPSPSFSQLLLSQPDDAHSASSGQPHWRYLDAYFKHYYPCLSVIPKDYFYQWVPVESNFLLDAMYALGSRELGDINESLMFFERAKQGVFDIMVHHSFSSIHGLYLIGIYALCRFHFLLLKIFVFLLI
jgi:hypothetical protein